jgi:hypothetical protein
MSFTGLVAELPIGQDGLTGSKNAALIKPTHLLQADGVSFFGDVLSKEGGASKYNASAITGDHPIRGGWDWWPTTTTQRAVIVTDEGKILKDSGGGTFATELKSGLTINDDDVPVFVEGGKEAAAEDRKLFIFTPSNQVQVLAADGATTSNISAPPADWTNGKPIFGCIHIDRLWAGGNTNDPYRLYASLATDHEDYTTTPLSLSIFPGEGEQNVAAISFKGLLIVFRYPVGIYLVDTRDPTSSNWTIERLSKTLGCAGPGCVVALEDDIMFLDPAGNLQLLSGVTEFGNLGLRSVSTESNFQTYFKQNVNISKLSRARAVLYPTKREVHWAVPGPGSTVNDARMVVDLNRPPQLRFRWSTRDVCESIWIRKNSDGIRVPYHGDNEGFVWEMDTDSKNKDSDGYSAIWQSSHDDLSWLDPSLATVRKSGKFLELVVEPQGNWNLDVQVYWDGRLHQTVTFNMGVTGAALGSFELGSDILGNSPLANRKKRITGSGRRLSLRGNNSGADQDYSVLRFLLHFKASSQRLEAES